MDLDDFKTKENAEGGGGEAALTHLREAIRENMNKERRKALVFTVVLISLASLYMVSRLQGETDYNAGLYFVSAGFLLGAVYLYLKSRTLHASIYDLPVAEFATKARKRLVYFRFIDWLIVLPLLALLGTGGGMILISRLMRYTDNFILLLVIWIAFFTGLSVFGFFAGKKNWERDHGNLYREIEKLEKSLTEA